MRRRRTNFVPLEVNPNDIDLDGNPLEVCSAVSESTEAVLSDVLGEITGSTRVATLPPPTPAPGSLGPFSRDSRDSNASSSSREANIFQQDFEAASRSFGFSDVSQAASRRLPTPSRRPVQQVQPRRLLTGGRRTTAVSLFGNPELVLEPAQPLGEIRPRPSAQLELDPRDSRDPVAVNPAAEAASSQAQPQLTQENIEAIKSNLTQVLQTQIQIFGQTVDVIWYDLPLVYACVAMIEAFMTEDGEPWEWFMNSLMSPLVCEQVNPQDDQVRARLDIGPFFKQLAVCVRDLDWDAPHFLSALVTPFFDRTPLETDPENFRDPNSFLTNISTALHADLSDSSVVAIWGLASSTWETFTQESEPNWESFDTSRQLRTNSEQAPLNWFKFIANSVGGVVRFGFSQGLISLLKDMATFLDFSNEMHTDISNIRERVALIRSLGDSQNPEHPSILERTNAAKAPALTNTLHSVVAGKNRTHSMAFNPATVLGDYVFAFTKLLGLYSNRQTYTREIEELRTQLEEANRLARNTQRTLDAVRAQAQAEGEAHVAYVLRVDAEVTSENLFKAARILAVVGMILNASQLAENRTPAVLIRRDVGGDQEFRMTFRVALYFEGTDPLGLDRMFRYDWFEALGSRLPLGERTALDWLVELAGRVETPEGVVTELTFEELIEKVFEHFNAGDIYDSGRLKVDQVLKADKLLERHELGEGEDPGWVGTELFVCELLNKIAPDLPEVGPDSTSSSSSSTRLAVFSPEGILLESEASYSSFIIDQIFSSIEVPDLAWTSLFENFEDFEAFREAYSFEVFGQWVSRLRDFRAVLGDINTAPQASLAVPHAGFDVAPVLTQLLLDGVNGNVSFDSAASALNMLSSDRPHVSQVDFLWESLSLVEVLYTLASDPDSLRHAQTSVMVSGQVEARKAVAVAAMHLLGRASQLGALAALNLLEGLGSHQRLAAPAPLDAGVFANPDEPGKAYYKNVGLAEGDVLAKLLS